MKETNELKIMEAYRVLKELLVSLGLEDELPSYKEFTHIYNEEIEEAVVEMQQQ